MNQIIVLIAAIVFTSMSSFGHLANDKGGSLIVGKCYPTFPSHYLVVKKIDKSTYELRGNEMSPNAILKTKIKAEQMNIIRKMGPLNMDLKYMGVKVSKMENGFDEPVDFWEDCIVKPPELVKTPKSKKKSEAPENFNQCNDTCYNEFKENKKEGLACYEKCGK